MTAVPAPRLYDAACRSFIERRPAAAVSWWLMACFAYYHEDAPILSDGMFEELTLFIAAHWDAIEHPHKSLITREDLAAGSGFALGHYPAVVIGAVRRIAADGIADRPSGSDRSPRQDRPSGSDQMSMF